MSTVISGQDSNGTPRIIQTDTDGAVVITGADVSVDVTVGGVPEVYTNTVTAEVHVEFSDTCNYLLIDNSGTSNNLYFSLDQGAAGSTWFTLSPESSIDFPAEVAKVHLKSTGGTNYQVIATIPSTS